MADSVTSAAEQCDDQWNEIEEFLAHIAERAGSCDTLEDFASDTLNRTVDLLDASGGTVWIVDELDEIRALCHADPSGSAFVGEESNARTAHHQFLQSVVQSGEAQTELFAGRLDHREGKKWRRTDAPSASHSVSIGVPFGIDHNVAGVLEIAQPAHSNTTARKGSERLLAMVSDLAGEFLRQQQVQDLKTSSDEWRQYEAMSQRAHGSLDLRDTAYQLVNDGHLFLKCDRVSLAVPLGRELQVLAISGVDTPDRRSSVVRSMEELVEAVAQTRQWLRYRGDTDPFPPQLEKPLSIFVDDSHSQIIDVVPLLAASSSESETPRESETTSDLVGIVVLERFDAEFVPGIEDLIIRFANVCSSALRNALDYQTLPFLSLARWARRAIRIGELQRRKLTITGILVLVSIVALSFVPATFRIEAEGKARPLIRRNIYAPFDGEVLRVEADHDEQVSKDRTLIVLRSRDLELELQRLQGEYQTIQKKLLAVASARIQTGADDTTDRIPGQLAAEEQELKQQLASVQTQIDLVRLQREDLDVQSPIDGRILTWDPAELLRDRPVQRGQLLVSVADLGGPWVLELPLPDRRVGHVIAAQRERQEPLDVEFTLAAGAAPSYRGTLEQIAARTEVMGDEQASTRVLVSVPPEAVSMLRPGTTIRARIDCGRRSLGFVWFHEIIETVRSWLFF